MIKWMLVLLLLATGPVWAQESKEQAPKDPAAKKQPSLADLARQSRQRTANAEKPARSFTNADLARLKGANVSTSSSPATEPQAKPDEATGEPDDAKPEGLSPEELEKWKKAFDEARVNLQNTVNEALVLQLRMNNLRNAFLRQSDGVTQQRVQSQLQETFDQIEKNQRDRRDARAAVEKLQREARDAGLSRSQIEEFTGQLPADPPDILSETTRDSG